MLTHSVFVLTWHGPVRAVSIKLAAFYLDVTIDEVISLANSNAYIHIQ